MYLSLIENGLDSLRNGYGALNQYNELQISGGSDLEKSLALKNAIIQTHHGIEILMKYILSQNSEYLIFSSLDDNVKNAYKEKHQKKLDSVFQTTNIDKVHTVTFLEAFERLLSICNHSFSKEFIEKIKLLNLYRNRLTHSEISIDDETIILLFNGFLDELDLYLFEKMGNEYKTLSGYSELIKNYVNYETWLLEHNMVLKAKVLGKLTEIFQKLHINMGVNEVKRITDINVCNSLFKELYKAGFKLGTDLYNGTCSGDVSSLKRISDKHFSLFARDNNGEEIFKFKSLIIYNPRFDTNFSPIFIFESDNDELPSDKKIAIRSEYSISDKFVIDGFKIETEKEIIYEKERLCELYEKINSGELDFKFHHVCKYLSKTIFCMINIQGLHYGKFDRIVAKYYDKDGAEFEFFLRTALKNSE